MRHTWEEIYERVQRKCGEPDSRGVSEIFEDEIFETHLAMDELFQLEKKQVTPARKG